MLPRIAEKMSKKETETDTKLLNLVLKYHEVLLMARLIEFDVFCCCCCSYNAFANGPGTLSYDLCILPGTGNLLS